MNVLYVYVTRHTSIAKVNLQTISIMANTQWLSRSGAALRKTWWQDWYWHHCSTSSHTHFLSQATPISWPRHFHSGEVWVTGGSMLIWQWWGSLIQWRSSSYTHKHYKNEVNCNKCFVHSVCVCEGEEREKGEEREGEREGGREGERERRWKMADQCRENSTRGGACSLMVVSRRGQPSWGWWVGGEERSRVWSHRWRWPSWGWLSQYIER